MKIYRCITVIVFTIISLSTFAQTDSSKTTILRLNGTDKGTEPLVIIDGNKQYIRGSAAFNGLDPANIESINIFKGDKAIQNYGSDGSDGVISIKTKSGKLTPLSTKDNISLHFKGLNTSLKTPLYILDGDIVEEKAVRLIKQDTISNVNVLSGAKATSLYGIRGNNGVVIITTKIKP
ncbi:TonB-dependent receptor plug domain-containing protein [Pedobacter cryotolerans]|uniref:TonB-dependent receptor plug domain-containing protein n=1 Tax=Pedobacter cryotolerans TaxID=2571270 RepID=A0A4U1CBK6_9SPHI|nr:TonB-dependent receptor plug domain-containing protein [Pedobacter cryotolerans]TKC03328.1 hypothetical protein FA045_01810 [Pedobacter cryotolerans]